MGIAELFVIAIVGLLVIGPEKLPETIKNCLVWFGRIKRVLNDTRTELEQQLGVDDIRRDIHNEEVMSSLKTLKKATEEAEKATLLAGNAVKDELSGVTQAIQAEVEQEDEGLFGEQRANHPASDTIEEDQSSVEASSPETNPINKASP